MHWTWGHTTTTRAIQIEKLTLFDESHWSSRNYSCNFNESFNFLEQINTWIVSRSLLVKIQHLLLYLYYFNGYKHYPRIYCKCKCKQNGLLSRPRHHNINYCNLQNIKYMKIGHIICQKKTEDDFAHNHIHTRKKSTNAMYVLMKPFTQLKINCRTK